MKLYGTILVFKPGIPKEEILKALDKVVDVLDDDYWLKPGSRISRDVPLETVPFRLQEFDDEEGGPVWYIP